MYGSSDILEIVDPEKMEITTKRKLLGNKRRERK